MTKHIFRTVFFVAVSVFVISTVIFMTVLYNHFSDVQRDRMRTQIDLALRGVENGGIDYLKNLKVTDCRITWIDADGEVLHDSVSDAGKMENHLDRKEIKEALAGGYGESIRYSSTMTERYLYCAKKLTEGDMAGSIIRLSITQKSLLTLTLGMLPPIVIIFIIAVILSLVLADRLSKNIVKPFNTLDLDKPLDNAGYDELSPLLRRIDAQQREIKRQKDELEQKRNEFEVMTSAMEEGIILLNCRGNILSINRAAAELFETDICCVGEDILSVNRSMELSGLLNLAGEGRRAETVMEIKREGYSSPLKYQVEASPILSGEEVSGIALLILNVTEKQKAEQMRREFTANVSHELKTPLQIISGNAELLANGMVKPEDVSDFSKRIYDESKRMIRLIDDIIKLSRLDENAGNMKMEWENVDLRALAEETVEMLYDEAKEADVKLEVHGERVSVYGVGHLIRSIIYNLCDNAIRYNRKGGFASINVEKENGCAVITVADSGIGISAEDRERIFERFYRVDKSHSNEVSGTGLGLSIVRHAAKVLHAEIELQSRPGEGSIFKVKIKDTPQSGVV